MSTTRHHTSRLSTFATLAALALAACAEPAVQPPRTAEDAPPATTETAPPAAPPSAPPGDGAGQAPAAAGAPATDPAVDGYVFKKKMPAVGAKFVEEELKTMSLTLNVTPPKAGAKAIKVVKSERESVEKAVEVLAVSADAVTKVKVTYKAHSKIETEGGVDTPKTSPVAGKSYVVESKNGAVSVLSDRGAPVPEAEAKEVKGDFKSLGRPDRMQNALPDTPIKVGDKVESLAQALRDRMSKDDEDDESTKVTVEKSTITLARVNDAGPVKTGVFSVQLDLLMEKPEMVMRMKMAGEVEARMDSGQVVSMSFQAPLMVNSPAKASGPKVSGVGLATMSSTQKAQ